MSDLLDLIESQRVRAEKAEACVVRLTAALKEAQGFIVWVIEQMSMVPSPGKEPELLKAGEVRVDPGWCGVVGDGGRMNPPIPLLDERSPGATCGRRLPSGECGAHGTWHLIDKDLENIVCCDAHAKEAREKWDYLFWHEFKWPCTQPDSVLRYEDDGKKSWCALDDGTRLGKELSKLEAENPAVREAAERLDEFVRSGARETEGEA